MSASKRGFIKFAVCITILFSLTHVSIASDLSECDEKLQKVDINGTLNTERVRAPAKAALDCYSNVLKSDPDNADAYCGIGEAYFFIGFSDRSIPDLEKSQKALKKALEIKPDHDKAKNQLMETEGWIQLHKD